MGGIIMYTCIMFQYQIQGDINTNVFRVNSWLKRLHNAISNF
jgi:hypothetical protein